MNDIQQPRRRRRRSGQAPDSPQEEKTPVTQQEETEPAVQPEEEPAYIPEGLFDPDTEEDEFFDDKYDDEDSNRPAKGKKGKAGKRGKKGGKGCLLSAILILMLLAVFCAVMWFVFPEKSEELLGQVTAIIMPTPTIESEGRTKRLNQ